MGKEVDMLWEACQPLLEGIREVQPSVKVKVVISGNRYRHCKVNGNVYGGMGFPAKSRKRFEHIWVIL